MALRDIKGHTSIRELIARAVARDTLPPSLVLTGPDGVGKRRLALAVAELLNCDARPEAAQADWDACGESRACQRIRRGVHADVLLVEPGDTGHLVRTDQGPVRSQAVVVASGAASTRGAYEWKCEFLVSQPK